MLGLGSGLKASSWSSDFGLGLALKAMSLVLAILGLGFGLENKFLTFRPWSLFGPEGHVRTLGLSILGLGCGLETKFLDLILLALVLVWP